MGGLNLEVFKVGLSRCCSATTDRSVLSLTLALTLSSTSVVPNSGRKDTDTNPTQKFGMYVMFPIGIMYYFGTNLDERFSVPEFWPKPEQTNKIPTEREEIQAELERLRQKRLYIRDRRLAAEAQTRAREQQQQQQSEE